MPSTPAPLPSLGLLDGLGTASSGAVGSPAYLPSLGLLGGLGTAPSGVIDSPAPLPSLGLLGGLGTAPGATTDPAFVWHDPVPAAWFADIGFAAIYAWVPVGIPVSQRDEAIQYTGTVDELVFASALSTAAGTYTAPATVVVTLRTGSWIRYKIIS